MHHHSPSRKLISSLSLSSFYCQPSDNGDGDDDPSGHRFLESLSLFSAVITRPCACALLPFSIFDLIAGANDIKFLGGVVPVPVVQCAMLVDGCCRSTP